MPDGTMQIKPLRLLGAARLAFSAGEGHRYVVASINWIALVAPHIEPHFTPDPLALVQHCAMVGRDQAYYGGLLKLFTSLRLGD